MNKRDELKVFISQKESICSECKENLNAKAYIFLNREKVVLCLSCADLDHLDFLQPGDKALTIRAKKYSKIHAVVLKYSHARKRYERQGLLVQKEAIEKAEQECLNDADYRERRRVHENKRRGEIDQDFKQSFAERIHELYSNCPQGCELLIAEHACQKYSGRVGRSAGAKDLEESAIKLAIIAHIRHTMTEYDELLFTGHDRYSARSNISDQVQEILNSWQ